MVISLGLPRVILMMGWPGDEIISLLLCQLQIWQWKKKSTKGLTSLKYLGLCSWQTYMPDELASTSQDNDESPWDDSASAAITTTEAEWTRLSSGFQNASKFFSSLPTMMIYMKKKKLFSIFDFWSLLRKQAGYRDGITAGKESALQEGFDAGFEQAGAPRGRELGLLRGLASALHIHLSHPTQQQQQNSREWEEAARTNAREIAETLATVRFSDIIVPLEPEEEEAGHAAHCVDAGGDSGHGEQEEKRGEEEVPRGEDLRALRVRLETLLHQVGLQFDLNLEWIDSLRRRSESLSCVAAIGWPTK
jgi:Essential protein Yae1, N terminal